MDLDAFIKYLIERKDRLVQQERMAIGKAKLSINAQIQVFESILIFVVRNKTNREATMEELELSLDKEARSLDELKPRRSNNEVTKAIIRLVDSLKPGTFKKVTNEKVKPRSIAAKVYVMKKKGILREDISVVTRGSELYISRKK